MRTTVEYSALVVDDEALIRTGTMRALSRCGFACVPAADGKEALDLLNQSSYDVVVTDLRMPEKNGHALAVELTSRKLRPVIVVLTGVVEPKLAEDLLLRGVDDIQYKPVEFGAFAEGVKALVDAKARATAVQKGFAVADSAISSSGNERSVDEWTNIKPADVHDVVRVVKNRFDVPPVDFDGFRLSSSNTFDVASLAAAIEARPAMAIEVLKLANGAFYRSAERIHELEKAVKSRASATPQSSITAGSVQLLVGGIVLGWVLSWIGASVLLFK